jgi:pyruvate formate lyase activating enzyme
MDIKTQLTDERYDTVTRTEGFAKSARESISIIMNSGIDYEFRTTVVPKVITDRDIEGIASAIAGAKKFVLQRFLPENTLDPALLSIEAQSDEEMERLAGISRGKVATSWR